MTTHERTNRTRIATLLAAALLALTSTAARADTVVSFGVQGGLPTIETIGGLSVEPREVAATGTPKVISAGLLSGEDIDAYHFLPTSSMLFSTTTSALLGGVFYTPGDIVEFDGRGYSLFFDGNDIVSAAANIDAFSILPNGNLLISTSLSSEIYGFAFLNGDVVEVDPVAETASLYEGLDEATLFTGANQDIDGLHYDEATGNLLISVRTAGGGTVAGLTYSADESDVFELQIAGTVTATTHLDGDGLYDGFTRQVDAVFVPEPGFAMAIPPLLLALGMIRGRRRTAHPVKPS